MTDTTAVTEKMVTAFWSKVEVQRTGAIRGLEEGISAALSAGQARPVVKALIPTQRIDDLISSGIPTSDETHDMAVELLNHRRALSSLVSQPVAWRVRDYADGWIVYNCEFSARHSKEAKSGAIVEPLYSVPSSVSVEIAQ